MSSISLFPRLLSVPLAMSSPTGTSSSAFEVVLESAPPALPAASPAASPAPTPVGSMSALPTGSVWSLESQAWIPIVAAPSSEAGFSLGQPVESVLIGEALTEAAALGTAVSWPIHPHAELPPVPLAHSEVGSLVEVEVVPPVSPEPPEGTIDQPVPDDSDHDSVSSDITIVIEHVLPFANPQFRSLGVVADLSRLLEGAEGGGAGPPPASGALQPVVAGTSAPVAVAPEPAPPAADVWADLLEIESQPITAPVVVTEGLVLPPYTSPVPPSPMFTILSMTEAAAPAASPAASAASPAASAAPPIAPGGSRRSAWGTGAPVGPNLGHGVATGPMWTPPRKKDWGGYKLMIGAVPPQHADSVVS